MVNSDNMDPNCSSVTDVAPPVNKKNEVHIIKPNRSVTPEKKDKEVGKAVIKEDNTKKWKPKLKTTKKTTTLNNIDKSPIIRKSTAVFQEPEYLQ